MTSTRETLVQLVIVWLLTLNGDRARLEPVYVSRPMPLFVCEALQIRVRLRKTKHITAYCI